MSDPAEFVDPAVPSEPPICWLELSTALATPASLLLTPVSARLESGTSTNASPMLISNSPGSTWVTQLVVSEMEV